MWDSFTPFGLRKLHLDIFKRKCEIGYKVWMRLGIFVFLVLIWFFHWYTWFSMREYSKLCLHLSLVDQSKRKISQEERKDEAVWDFVVLDFLPEHDFWSAARVVYRRRQSNIQTDMADKWQGYLPFLAAVNYFCILLIFGLSLWPPQIHSTQKFNQSTVVKKKRGCDRITPIKQMVEKCF